MVKKMVEMVKKEITLKKSAISSIFPNCPSYLTDVATKPKRLSWHDKDQKRVQEPYDKSLIDHGETEAKFILSTRCIFSKLNLIQLPNAWLTHQPNSNTIIFLKIQFDNDVSTTIDRSIIVDENVFCQAF